VTTTGYACDVDDEPAEPGPIIDDDIITPNITISLLEIDTSIDMTVEEGNWLQLNVIKHRKPEFLFRN
jgi:hypothetical protein